MPTHFSFHCCYNSRLLFDEHVKSAQYVYPVSEALRAVNIVVMFKGVTVVPKERLEAIHEAFGFNEAFPKDHDYVAGDESPFWRLIPPSTPSLVTV